jgi:hypothetical protein
MKAGAPTNSANNSSSFGELQGFPVIVLDRFQSNSLVMAESQGN